MQDFTSHILEIMIEVFSQVFESIRDEVSIGGAFRAPAEGRPPESDRLLSLHQHEKGRPNLQHLFRRSLHAAETHFGKMTSSEDIAV